MKTTYINDLILFELVKFSDNRGFFIERFNTERFKPLEFIQDNHSRSQPGVIRGLHYQFDPHQGKLVGVLHGRIWDVVVDLRSRSNMFCKYFSFELDETSLLWVPPGFAHGFCVLGNESADVLYKVSVGYNPKGESGINYADSDLNIKWPVSSPIVSDRDKCLPLLRKYVENPVYT